MHLVFKIDDLQWVDTFNLFYILQSCLAVMIDGPESFHESKIRQHMYILEEQVRTAYELSCGQPFPGKSNKLANGLTAMAYGGIHLKTEYRLRTTDQHITD